MSSGFMAVVLGTSGRTVPVSWKSHASLGQTIDTRPLAWSESMQADSPQFGQRNQNVSCSTTRPPLHDNDDAGGGYHHHRHRLQLPQAVHRRRRVDAQTPRAGQGLRQDVRWPTDRLALIVMADAEQPADAEEQAERSALVRQQGCSPPGGEADQRHLLDHRAAQAIITDTATPAATATTITSFSAFMPVRPPAALPGTPPASRRTERLGRSRTCGARRL